MKKLKNSLIKILFVILTILFIYGCWRLDRYINWNYDYKNREELKELKRELYELKLKVDNIKE